MSMTQSILYRVQNRALPREEMEEDMYIHMIFHLVTRPRTNKDLIEIPQEIDAGMVIIKSIDRYFLLNN